jgi:RNA polymerase sigma-70 factor, ECF subfamily
LRRFCAHATIYRLAMNSTGQKIMTPPTLVEARGAIPLSFDEVYARWFHDVSRWARAFGGLDADLDDLTQEVFLVVRRKLPAFDGKNLSGWLYRIAQRTVSDYRRRAWFRRLLPGKGRPKAEPESAAPPRDPAELFERREAERLLVQILGRMNETRRATFVLFEIEGYSGDEIAALEGVPVNTVWTRLHHARKEFATLVARAREEGRIP